MKPAWVALFPACKPARAAHVRGKAGKQGAALKARYRICWEMLRFAAASLLSFSLDYGLYSLLTCATEASGAAHGVIMANIGARLVSAAVNYALNRRLVFKSNARLIRSIAQYAMLAGGILAGNTLVLAALVEWFDADRYVAKLVTELIFFLVSWLVQRKCIFKKTALKQKTDQGSE